MAKDLRDTDEKLKAVADEAAREAVRMSHLTPPPSDSSETMDNKILEHEKECRETGPIAKLRDDVAGLKAWVKGIGIAIFILQAVQVWNALTNKPAAHIPAAHADTVIGSPAK